MPGVKEYYDVQYAQANYFGYREWSYAPYISSLAAFAGLKPGARVLDVGCGQGFFSCLFHKCGMRVHGIDISETGVALARKQYGNLGITFEAADINTATFPQRFDCIFVRSCSLYNSEDFVGSGEITATLLRHLAPEGVCIFAHNSNFSGRPSTTCKNHSLEDVRAHFREYPDVRVYFSSRIDTWLARRFAFNPIATRVNILLSRIFGIGGDIIVVLKRRSAEAAGCSRAVAR
jgi:SAM-dependent methyltransferase